MKIFMILIFSNLEKEVVKSNTKMAGKKLKRKKPTFWKNF